MRYIKDNVERYVNNLADARRLEYDGFRLVEDEAPKKKEQVLSDVAAEAVIAHRGRRKKGI